uniref:Uncharacterized protein n=1 Tax=Tanacetum cinerariifolium TaxID=118510 RepID=A0A6L2LY12_TANCI|nr:hypothetical protein [Tanacetum cinerariifolium]
MVIYGIAKQVLVGLKFRELGRNSPPTFIGCKVMRTLASVEFEVMLILGWSCCLSSSSVRCLESSSRVPVPLPEDPYEAIRYAYLVRTDTEYDPFEGEARTPESPHIVAPPTCHVKESEGSGTTARMAVRVPPVMSRGLSVGMAEVAAMSDSVFHTRFRSSYDSSPSPTLPVRKRYRGKSELILGTDSEEDEEVEESSDSDTESEDVEDEG